MKSPWCRFVVLVAGIGLTGAGCGVEELRTDIPYQSFARVEMDLQNPQLERGFVYELRGLADLNALADLNILPDIDSASYFLQDSSYLGLLVVPSVNSMTCCQYLSAVTALALSELILEVEMSLSAISGSCGLNNCIIKYIPAELLVVRNEGIESVELRYDDEGLPTREF